MCKTRLTIFLQDLSQNGMLEYCIYLVLKRWQDYSNKDNWLASRQKWVGHNCFLVTISPSYLNVQSGIWTQDLTACLYLNLNHGELGHSATTAGLFRIWLLHLWKVVRSLRAKRTTTKSSYTNIAHWLQVPGDHGSNPGDEKKCILLFWVVISWLTFALEFMRCQVILPKSEMKGWNYRTLF